MLTRKPRGWVIHGVNMRKHLCANCWYCCCNVSVNDDDNDDVYVCTYRRVASSQSSRWLRDVHLLSVYQRQRWSARHQRHIQRVSLPTRRPQPRWVLSSVLRVRCGRGRSRRCHGRPCGGVHRCRRTPVVVVAADLCHHVALGQLHVSPQCHVRHTDTGQHLGLWNGQPVLLYSVYVFLLKLFTFRAPVVDLSAFSW